MDNRMDERNGKAKTERLWHRTTGTQWLFYAWKRQAGILSTLSF